MDVNVSANCVPLPLNGNASYQKPNSSSEFDKLYKRQEDGESSGGSGSLSFEEREPLTFSAPPKLPAFSAPPELSAFSASPELGLNADDNPFTGTGDTSSDSSDTGGCDTE